MDTSSLVHDFLAVLCVVFGAVFDRQDVEEFCLQEYFLLAMDAASSCVLFPCV